MAALRFSGVATLAIGIGMGFYLREPRPHIFRIQITFTEAAFRAVLTQWPPSARAKFAAHFKADFAFLIAYAAFGFFLGQHLAAGSTSPPNQLALALQSSLPLAAACDAIENLLHQRFLAADAGTLPASRFRLAGVAATAKWVLVLGFLLLLVAALSAG